MERPDLSALIKIYNKIDVRRLPTILETLPAKSEDNRDLASVRETGMYWCGVF